MEAVQTNSVKKFFEQQVFDQQEVATLRNELRECGLDCWQAGELIEKFVRCRGYGISSRAARDLALHFDSSLPLEDVTKQLESAALVM
jgi:hypothetical protein